MAVHAATRWDALATLERGNEDAALDAGPAVYALLMACRRGTDRWSEPDFAGWVAEARAKLAARAALAAERKGKG